MQTFDEISKAVIRQLEAKPVAVDIENWYYCLDSIDKSMYVPLQYKPDFLRYQAEYFKDVYPDYQDISMVLYRGGRAVGIWPICMYTKDDQLHFGTAGGGG